MSDIKRAEDFLRQYKADYRALLEDAFQACKQVESALGGVVADVYTRGSSQDGEEFKDAGKMAAKLRQRGMQTSATNFMSLNDVVGLTVVVQYPDQVDDVVRRIKLRLASSGTKAGRPERHENKGGYFASHLVCSSQRGGETLRCEIQIKTMLHDAWSAKMHDLTYKPGGMLDPRLSALMASIAVTIQNLEEQSRLIRDMIQAGWNVEEEARLAARKFLFESMLREGADTSHDSGDDEILALRRKVERASITIDAGGPKAVNDLAKLTAAVNGLGSKGGRERHAWMLAGRVASIKPSANLTRFFQNHADAWLGVAPGFLSAGIVEAREIAAVPLMFYVFGDLERAIDYASRLLHDPSFATMPSATRDYVEFNRACFMVEREYHAPTRDEPRRMELRAEVDRVLDARYRSASDDDKSSVLDSIGFAKITFARTREEVRAGIEDCVASASAAPLREKEVASAYMELNLRLGWRRYFEIEIMEKGGTPPVSSQVIGTKAVRRPPS